MHTLGRSRVRRVRKALICLALCVVLLCATAVAAREFGLLSFWQREHAGNQELLAALEEEERARCIIPDQNSGIYF